MACGISFREKVVTDNCSGPLGHHRGVNESRAAGRKKGPDDRLIGFRALSYQSRNLFLSDLYSAAFKMPKFMFLHKKILDKTSTVLENISGHDMLYQQARSPTLLLKQKQSHI